VGCTLIYFVLKGFFYYSVLWKWISASTFSYYWFNPCYKSISQQMFVEHFFLHAFLKRSAKIIFLKQYQMVVPTLNWHFQSYIDILNNKIVIYSKLEKKHIVGIQKYFIF